MSYKFYGITLEISELLLPVIVIQILQSIKELVCHTFPQYKNCIPKLHSAGNTRHIAASAMVPVKNYKRYKLL